MKRLLRPKLISSIHKARNLAPQPDGAVSRFTEESQLSSPPPHTRVTLETSAAAHSLCMPLGADCVRHCSGATEGSPAMPQGEACWSCQSSSRSPDRLFCADCGILQQVDRSQNYFKVMGAKEGVYDLDDSHLDRQYKYLQRQLHPDKFANKSQEEKERSAEASSLVNEAFSTLKSPLKRGEYLLQQQGIEAGEGTIEDPELLMGIMEARESIEATRDLDELRKFATTFHQQADNCIQGISQAFAHGDMQKAQELVTLLRYVTNIQSAVLEKL